MKDLSSVEYFSRSFLIKTINSFTVYSVLPLMERSCVDKNNVNPDESLYNWQDGTT